MTPTRTSHGRSSPRYVPVEGDQPDGEGDVPVFGVGAECGPGDAQGIRGNGTQRLRGHWPIPDLHPPVDKEVDATALCDPLPPHLQRQSLALQRTTLYVSAQIPYVPSPPSYVSPPETPSPFYLTSSPASFASPPTPLISRISRPRSSWRCHRQATRSC